MRKLYVVLVILSLFLGGMAPPALAQTRPAEKATPGSVIRFTLEANASKDIAIFLPKGEYVVQADLKLVEEKATNIQMEVDLLKSNGVLVQDRVLAANEVHRVARIARPLRLAKPLNARLRVTNENVPMEIWLTVIPAAKRAFTPFAFYDGQIGTLGIGEANGKGGTLAKRPEDGFYTYHKAVLPAGKYDVSLYLKQTDGSQSNLQGALTLLDRFGVAAREDWKLNVNEIGAETRKDKRLVLVKPATVFFLVTNDGSLAYDYTVGIEKATD